MHNNCTPHCTNKLHYCCRKVKYSFLIHLLSSGEISASWLNGKLENFVTQDSQVQSPPQNNEFFSDFSFLSHMSGMSYRLFPHVKNEMSSLGKGKNPFFFNQKKYFFNGDSLYFLMAILKWQFKKMPVVIKTIPSWEGLPFFCLCVLSSPFLQK